MNEIKALFSNNKKWSLRMTRKDKYYFRRLARLHKPQFLWIGCSDSRVPANEIVGLLPGELFVHRNVANMVYPNDLNCVSVLEYAVKVLQIKHLIVCGHYNCGGVRAVVEKRKLGRTNIWLREIKDTMLKNKFELSKVKTESAKINRLCELNVLRQAEKLAQIDCVRRAIKAGQAFIHTWIYDLHDGLIKILE